MNSKKRIGTAADRRLIVQTRKYTSHIGSLGYSQRGRGNAEKGERCCVLTSASGVRI